jgi:large subunit ribosomal protein L18
VDIPLSEEAFPDENRINGTHVSKYAADLKKDKDLYEKRFSKLISKDLDPEDYPKHFEEIRNKILSSNFE